MQNIELIQLNDNKEGCIVFCSFFVCFLTCANNASNWGGVACFISKWSLWALSQCWLHSIAFNLINPGLPGAMAKLSGGGNLMSPPAVQLSAHYRCIIHIPGLTAHRPPLAFVVVLDSSSATTLPTGQLHIAWKCKLSYECEVRAVQLWRLKSPCRNLTFDYFSVLVNCAPWIFGTDWQWVQWSSGKSSSSGCCP